MCTLQLCNTDCGSGDWLGLIGWKTGRYSLLRDPEASSPGETLSAQIAFALSTNLPCRSKQALNDMTPSNTKRHSSSDHIPKNPSLKE